MIAVLTIYLVARMIGGRVYLQDLGWEPLRRFWMRSKSREVRSMALAIGPREKWRDVYYQLGKKTETYSAGCR
jgi:hypothetical protein